jgi:citrate lyase beta subunit
MHAHSYLFVPGTQPQRIAKAFAAGAEAVIVDWEDAVAAAEKAQARENLAIYNAGEDARPVWLRINDAEAPEYAADVAAVAGLDCVVGIFLPKAQQAAHIEALYRATGKPVAVIVETATGMLNLAALAAAPGVARLTYGRLDLANDLGMAVHSAAAETVFDRLRTDLLLHSVANALPPPLDSVFPDFKNNAGLADYVARWRDMGFGGMLCIHPAQIAVIQQMLQADAAELDFARRVCAEFNASGSAAFQIDGKMVDLPVIRRAQALLSRYGS